jgi:hypothetical protein
MNVAHAGLEVYAIAVPANANGRAADGTTIAQATRAFFRDRFIWFTFRFCQDGDTKCELRNAVPVRSAATLRSLRYQSVLLTKRTITSQ